MDLILLTLEEFF